MCETDPSTPIAPFQEIPYTCPHMRGLRWTNYLNKSSSSHKYHASRCLYGTIYAPLFYGFRTCVFARGTANSMCRLFVRDAQHHSKCVSPARDSNHQIALYLRASANREHYYNPNTRTMGRAREKSAHAKKIKKLTEEISLSRGLDTKYRPHHKTCEFI